MPDRKTMWQDNSTNVRDKKGGAFFYKIGLKGMGLMFPALTRRLVEKHFFVPAKSALSVEDADMLSTGTPSVLAVAHKKIRCWRWGTGPAVAFVHGWGSRGIQFRSFIPAFVEAGYSVFLFDGPAHGESEGNETNYFEYSDCLKVLFHPGMGLNIKGVVAHSFGAAAVINWQAAEKMALPTVLFAPVLKLKEMIWRKLEAFGISSKIFQGIIKKKESLLDHDFDRENPYSLLPDVDSDILIIHDRRDRAVPFLETEEAAAKLSRLDLYVTEGLGHNRILHHQPVIEKVLDFFDPRLKSLPSEIPRAVTCEPQSDERI